MKLVMYILAALIAGISFGTSAACVQNNNELTGLVGLDGGNGRVFSKVISSSNECSCQYVRFMPENTDTRMAISVLLTAKTSGTKVRIDLLTEGDCDSGYRVYLQ